MDAVFPRNLHELTRHSKSKQYRSELRHISPLRSVSASACSSIASENRSKKRLQYPFAQLPNLFQTPFEQTNCFFEKPVEQSVNQLERPSEHVTSKSFSSDYVRDSVQTEPEQHKTGNKVSQFMAQAIFSFLKICNSSRIPIPYENPSWSRVHTP